MVARPSLKRVAPGSVPPWRAFCAESARAAFCSVLCVSCKFLNLFCCLRPSSGRICGALNLRAFCRGRGGAPPQLLRPSGRASAGGPGLASSRARLFFVAPSLFRAAATFFMAAPWFSTSGNQESAAAFRHHYA